jgi:hypothetical protein
MKWLLAMFVFSSVFVLQFSTSSRHPGRVLTVSERFGVELRGCQDAWASEVPGKCKLYGKIKYVESFPDVKIKVVESFPDIKVKIVDSFPDAPGKWKIVDSFPDYKVKLVESFPDYKIKFVDSFPGCD